VRAMRLHVLREPAFGINGSRRGGGFGSGVHSWGDRTAEFAEDAIPKASSKSWRPGRSSRSVIANARPPAAGSASTSTTFHGPGGFNKRSFTSEDRWQRPHKQQDDHRYAATRHSRHSIGSERESLKGDVPVDAEGAVFARRARIAL
jgi:hypothetical protein